MKWKIVYDICRKDTDGYQPVVLANPEQGGASTLAEAEALVKMLMQADAKIGQGGRSYAIFPLVRHTDFGQIGLVTLTGGGEDGDDGAPPPTDYGAS